jgi:hypothetical protein
MTTTKTTQVTREQAEHVLRLVEKKFRTWLMTWPVVDNKILFDAPLVPVAECDRPQLVENYGGTGRWAIVWESNSPTEWALGSLEDPHEDAELRQLARDAGAHSSAAYTVPGVDGMPEGVYAEAEMSFVLVLYKEG